jgi:dienelactone hydrolase
MKRTIFFLAAIALATPVMAQHVHDDMQAQPRVDPPAAVPAQGGAPVQGTGTAAPGQGRGPQTPPIDVPWNDAIPAGTPEHAARALKESPRHGEWADIKMADGTTLKSWVVYPERSTKAGVVLVIHDIRGLSDITRAVGDQLAQDGFIAVVPDFLSGKGPNGGGTDSLGTGVGQAIQSLTPDDVNARLNAAMEYGKKLPASNGKTGVIGFCWGGARSFGFAAAQPALNAAVVCEFAFRSRRLVSSNRTWKYRATITSAGVTVSTSNPSRQFSRSIITATAASTLVPQTTSSSAHAITCERLLQSLVSRAISHPP